MNKQREIAEDPGISYTDRYLNGNYVGKYGPWYSSPLLEKSSIAYTNGRKHDNPCSHTVTLRKNVKGSYFWRDVYPQYTYICHGDLAGMLGLISDWTPSPLMGLSDDLAAEAYEVMKPSFRDRQLSIGNFLWELREIRKGFKPLTELVKAWKTGFYKSKRWLSDGGYELLYFPSRRQWGLVRQLKWTNDTHLSLRYGWLPASRDVVRLWDRAVKFDSDLSAFIGRQGTPQVRRFRKFLESSGVLDSGVSTYGSQTVQNKTSTGIYTARMRYRYTLPQFSLAELRTRAFLDRFGVFPTSIFWEAVPYSFVIDWFTPVGDWIRSKEEDWLKPVVALESFCHSLKEQMLVEVEGGLQTAVSGNTLVPIAEVESKWYTRRMAIPHAIQLQLDANLSIDRIMAGTSLIFQRLL